MTRSLKISSCHYTEHHVLLSDKTKIKLFGHMMVKTIIEDHPTHPSVCNSIDMRNMFMNGASNSVLHRYVFRYFTSTFIYSCV